MHRLAWTRCCKGTGLIFFDLFGFGICGFCFDVGRWQVGQGVLMKPRSKVLDLADETLNGVLLCLGAGRICKWLSVGQSSGSEASSR